MWATVDNPTLRLFLEVRRQKNLWAESNAMLYLREKQKTKTKTKQRGKIKKKGDSLIELSSDVLHSILILGVLYDSSIPSNKLWAGLFFFLKDNTTSFNILFSYLKFGLFQFSHVFLKVCIIINQSI